MSSINFISNLDLTQSSGGWSGVNARLFEGLSRSFNTTYVGPISPTSDYRAKIISKLRRASGHPGSFHFFSMRRLRAIAREVKRKANEPAAYDFFHGITPWILYQSPRPYGAYLDACFSTYIDIYHSRSNFLEQDIQRICNIEAARIESAAHVFFSTQWALDETVKAYNVPRDNLLVAGIAGNSPVPVSDNYRGGKSFLFIALDFERKGGMVCWRAFQQVKASHPDAELIILGERPPDHVLASPGVAYKGNLRKTIPAELAQFQSILSTSFALVHPTTMDTNPMVVIEAGYHGCPAIAPRRFGIPEIILDGRTGVLVDLPIAENAFAAAMFALLNDPGRYHRMRTDAKDFASSTHSWETVVKRICSSISASLPSTIQSPRNNQLDAPALSYR